MMLFVWVLTTYPTYNEEVPATVVSLSTVPGTYGAEQTKQFCGSGFIEIRIRTSDSHQGPGFS
jgi:hypothetical protein